MLALARYSTASFTRALGLMGLLLLSARPVLALATEHFGNDPVHIGWNFAPDLLPVLNDRLRVYWYEVNGDACFYYRGDTAAANALLKRFAAGGKGREVILHPGPLEQTSLGGSRRISAEWYIHVPGGISLSDHEDGGLVTDKGPAIHLYVGRLRPKTAATPAQVRRWLEELDSESFEVRQRASRELARQGQAVEQTLRAALEAKPSEETRQRIKALLAKLPAINLDLLVIPEGMTVVGPDDLLVRCRKGLKSKDPVIRGVAAQCVADLEGDPRAAVAGLLRLLKEDGNEYVRRSVAGALERQGKAAEAALPLLRAGLRDPDVNVRNAFQHAIDTIGKAKEDPARQEKADRIRAIKEDIRPFVQRRSRRGKE